MAGIRYERDKIIGNLSEFEWGDNWGPRFHATWDPTKDNKTKLSFSWGRFYGKIPNDLAVRALSSEVTGFFIYDLADVDLSNRAFPVVTPGAVPIFDLFFGDVPTIVLEDSKITVQDEFIVGAEREIMPFFNLGASFMYRNLGSTLEDFATVPYSDLLEGAEFGSYVIGNPDLAFPDLFPKVSRKYKSFTLKADKRMHENWQMLASYTWSELKGNYEGFFRRDNGQSDPFITSLFDFPYLADPDIWAHIINDGILPNDRTHVLNAALGYDLGRGWRAGGRFTYYTGVPNLDAPAGLPEGFRLPSPTREPGFYRIDVRLEKKWTFGETTWLSFVAEVLNVTLNKETVRGNEIGPVTIPSIGLEGGF